MTKSWYNSDTSTLFTLYVTYFQLYISHEQLYIEIYFFYYYFLFIFTIKTQKKVFGILTVTSEVYSQNSSCVFPNLNCIICFCLYILIGNTLFSTPVFFRHLHIRVHDMKTESHIFNWIINKMHALKFVF